VEVRPRLVLFSLLTVGVAVRAAILDGQFLTNHRRVLDGRLQLRKFVRVDEAVEDDLANATDGLVAIGRRVLEGGIRGSLERLDGVEVRHGNALRRGHAQWCQPVLGVR
jgi:hypothetical protein